MKRLLTDQEPTAVIYYPIHNLNTFTLIGFVTSSGKCFLTTVYTSRYFSNSICNERSCFRLFRKFSIPSLKLKSRRLSKYAFTDAVISLYDLNSFPQIIFQNVTKAGNRRELNLANKVDLITNQILIHSEKYNLCINVLFS